MSKLNYRADIDGLRAIAVLGVVLFHARLGFPGGFVGVDVFFVISGYLITSIILKDIQAGCFSLAAFWDRRIRRIFPALFTVIVATSIVGWFVLLPTDMVDFGKSIAAQTFFGGNVFFWWNAGYFDAAATSKPLLHTWSLAVEEQYYLLVPLLALFRTSTTRKTLGKALVIIILLSLPLCIALTYHAPDAAFYLLPTRAWELAIGGLIAVMPATRGGKMSRIIAYAGLLAVAGSFLFFSENTPFPGSAALLPTLGTAALIWANACPTTDILARLMSFRPLVFIGKISYSLYLWHWPILVYSEYASSNPLRWYVRIVLVIVSIAMSALSLRFIETPVRTKNLLPTRHALFRFAAISGCCYLFLGLCASTFRGLPSEAKLKAEGYAKSRYDFPYKTLIGVDRAEKEDFAILGAESHDPIHCLVWGDSHGMAIVPAIDSLTQKFHSRTAVATYFATAPILGVESTSSASLKKESEAWSRAVVDYVAKNKVPNVLLVGRWCTYKSKSIINGQVPREEDLASMLAKTVAVLQQAGAKVWIFKEVPTYDIDIPRALTKACIKGESLDQIGMTEQEYSAHSQMENRLLDLAARQGASILDPKTIFFNGSGYCKVADSGFSIYRDTGHLSGKGALLFRPLFTGIWNDDKAASLQGSAALVQ
ncbi:MAG: acyltransferase family protein [Verrucomicrobia bacterium]|nr:acyltransferase family protein [Verrucomicrobiota bacterium]